MAQLTQSPSGENQALIDALLKKETPQPLTFKHDGLTVPVAVTRGACGGIGTIEDVSHLVDSQRSHPKRRKGKATFVNQRSFEKHALRFKSDTSTLWADSDQRQNPTLLSVLNYHAEGSDGTPQFGDHRGVYTFPLSEEWQAWNAGSGAGMSQREFAEFMDERLIDVANPERAPDWLKSTLEEHEINLGTASRLLKLTRGIKIHVASDVSNSQNLSSGESEIHFKTEHMDGSGGKLSVPQAFLIEMPIFLGGAPIVVAAFLRYRVKEGRITWSYRLYRADQAFDEAFEKACSAASENTGLPLFFGKPE